MSSPKAAVLVSALVLISSTTAVVLLAREERSPPKFCHPQLRQLGPRCCAAGQTYNSGRCVGAPLACPQGWQRTVIPAPACAVRPQRIPVDGGTMDVIPTDWEAAPVLKPRTITVGPFYIDATEVTYFRWKDCVEQKSCKARPFTEAGLPVTFVSRQEASAFCKFAGGRLPTGDEWIFAASGVTATRYPWGNTGLVCRRASFGLEDGPCADGSLGPDLAGARPDGATPSGILDLAGNVAEWTLEPDGTPLVRGGSYRSRLARELKTWAEHAAAPGPSVGFRCVYPSQPADLR